MPEPLEPEPLEPELPVLDGGVQPPPVEPVEPVEPELVGVDGVLEGAGLAPASPPRELPPPAPLDDEELGLGRVWLVVDVFALPEPLDPEPLVRLTLWLEEPPADQPPGCDWLDELPDE